MHVNSPTWADENQIKCEKVYKIHYRCVDTIKHSKNIVFTTYFEKMIIFSGNYQFILTWNPYECDKTVLITFCPLAPVALNSHYLTTYSQRQLTNDIHEITVGQIFLHYIKLIWLEQYFEDNFIKIVTVQPANWKLISHFKQLLVHFCWMNFRF